MIVYILLLIFVLLFSFVGSISRIPKFVSYVIFFILFIFSAFRFDVGIDYQSYVNVYNAIKEGLNGGIRELGYILLVQNVISIGGTQQLVFLIFALLTQYAFCSYILDNTKLRSTLFLSILIYFCVGPFFLASLSGIRQYLAISIFAFSLKYIKTKRLCMYVLFIILGSYFAHTTLLLMLPFYFLLNYKISFFYKIFVLGLVLILNQFLAFLIFSSTYAFYLTSSNEYVVNSTVYLFMIISLFLICFEYKLKNDDNRLFFNMNFFSFLSLLLIILNKNLTADMFLRMNNFFFIGVIILIPKLISLIKSSQYRFIISFIFILFVISYYFRNTIIYGEQSNLLPYAINEYLIE